MSKNTYGLKPIILRGRPSYVKISYISGFFVVKYPINLNIKFNSLLCKINTKETKNVKAPLQGVAKK